MTITKNPARQELVAAYVDFTFADLASGVDFPAIQLPAGAVVTGGDVTVKTAFNSATSDVVDVGDATVENRYLNDGALSAVARVPLVPTGFVTTPTQRDITLRWVGVSTAPTAGAARLSVQYYVQGRAAFAQG